MSHSRSRRHSSGQGGDMWPGEATPGHSQPVDFDTSSANGKLLGHIAAAETGGHRQGMLAYDAVGKATQGGHHALGAFQIMDYNVKSWARQAGCGNVSLEQFLADPQLQQKIAGTHIDALKARGMSDRQIAGAWLGKGKDANGMTTGRYADLVAGGGDYHPVAGHEGPRHSHGGRHHLRAETAVGWQADHHRHPRHNHGRVEVAAHQGHEHHGHGHHHGEVAQAGHHGHAGHRTATGGHTVGHKHHLAALPTAPGIG